MIRSMTGFGSAKVEKDGFKVSIEMKSVNNRFLDVSVRVPRNYMFVEELVKAQLPAYVSRGKLDAFVTVEVPENEETDVVINYSLAEKYYNELVKLKNTFNLQEDFSSFRLLQLPEVMKLEKKDIDNNILKDIVSDCLVLAAEDFNKMRQVEGGKLREDIESRLDTIESALSVIIEKSETTAADYKERLEAKIREVLQDKDIDDSRVLTEVAIFADKIAIDEEIVRLQSHIAQLRGFMTTGDSIGRKSDFLIQEFNREINTICSKCQNSEVAHVAVDVKAEIEKIREQIQNIE
mgnify:CR=1 FL=1